MIPNAPLHTFVAPLRHRIYCISGYAISWLIMALLFMSAAFDYPISNSVIFIGLGSFFLIFPSTLLLHDKLKDQCIQQFIHSLASIPLATLITASTSAELDSLTKEQIRLYLKKHHRGWSFPLNSQELTHHA